MKKNKLNSLIKTARKIAKKDIRSKLVAELRQTTSKFGPDSKKLIKEIEKGAKKLSKKLANELKIDVSALKEKSNVELKAKTTETTAERKKATPVLASTSDQQATKPSAATKAKTTAKPVTTKK